MHLSHDQKASCLLTMYSSPELACADIFAHFAKTSQTQLGNAFPFWLVSLARTRLRVGKISVARARVTELFRSLVTLSSFCSFLIGRSGFVHGVVNTISCRGVR